MAPNEISTLDWVDIIKQDAAQELNDIVESAEADVIIIPSKKDYRKAKRAYKRMRRRHRKELIKLIKEDKPWDYEYIFILLEKKLHQMIDYFSQDYNILQTDKSRDQILKGLCAAAHTLHNRNDGYEDNYYEQVADALKIIAENYSGWWD